MKKLLLGFLLCISLFTNAQTTPALPFPVHGKWVYYAYFGGCFENFQNFDTIYVNNLPYLDGNYKFEYCDGTFINGGCVNPDNYIRQEGNVWYKLFGTNPILFDWDSQEGDTIYYDGMIAENYPFIVSNIDTITTVDNVQRRTYHFVYAWDGQVPYYYNREVYMIEGIGCSVLGIDITGIEDFLFLLTCFYDENGLLIYQQDYPDWNIYGCCTEPESVEQIELMRLQIYPSPASENITLQFGNGPIPNSIQIFNTLGELVHTEATNGRQQVKLNIANLASGVYTVVAQSGSGSVVEKFVKE